MIAYVLLPGSILCIVCTCYLGWIAGSNGSWIELLKNRFIRNLIAMNLFVSASGIALLILEQDQALFRSDSNWVILIDVLQFVAVGCHLDLVYRRVLSILIGSQERTFRTIKRLKALVYSSYVFLIGSLLTFMLALSPNIVLNAIPIVFCGLFLFTLCIVDVYSTMTFHQTMISMKASQVNQGQEMSITSVEIIAKMGISICITSLVGALFCVVIQVTSNLMFFTVGYLIMFYCEVAGAIQWIVMKIRLEKLNSTKGNVVELNKQTTQNHD
jgi:hypothetical protein